MTVTAPFTDPTAPSYAPWSTIERNELQLAWSERCQAIGQTANPVLTTDDNPLDRSWWAAIQVWLEYYCTAFVDHTATISGSTSIPMLTLSQWRALAGLSSGFRRVTAWDGLGIPTFQYGIAQDGDIEGYWLYQDLMAGLSALKWTHRQGAEGASTDLSYRYGYGNGLTCNDARNAALADWSGRGWSSYGLYYMAYCEGSLLSGVHYEFLTHRSAGAAVLEGILDTIPHIADCYLTPSADPGFSASSFEDLDGLGMQDGKLWFYETLAEASTPTRTGTKLGYIDISPIASRPLNCPLAFTLMSFSIRVRPQDVHWVLKWAFTNAN
jgi:hypothetical protein